MARKSKKPRSMATSGADSREARLKLQPKIRMIANCSTQVNAIRAEMCSALAVNKAVRREVPPVRGNEAAPLLKRALPKTAARGHLKEPAKAKAHVFVELVEDTPGERRVHRGQSGRRSNIVAATVPIKDLDALAARPEVAYVELGQGLSVPRPDVSSDVVGPPPFDLRKFGSPRVHHDGKGVLIGIIDVMGFDFAHPDFRDEEGGTRWVAIWDQGGQGRPPPKGNGSGYFVYGSELRKEHLDQAIKQAPKAGVPPQDLEPQSQMEEGSHGTHVASIAAGRRGVCRKAYLAGVLISLPPEDEDRRRTFSDSTRIAHAVDYLLRIAHELGDVPVSINISLGTNGHAHDGSSPISRWIDSALSMPGRSVCTAAGNAGQEVAEFEGDMGYVMGRIHTSGTIAARELYADLEWTVVGNGIADVSENELELWYGPQDRFDVSVKPPGGNWIGPVEPRQFMENVQLGDGSLISIYNELYHPANGANYISIYLSPFLSEHGVVGVPAGEWTVRLQGREVRDGRYHGWIERDDPRRLGRVGDRDAWRFPSFFSERSTVDNSTVGSLSCGNRVIAVANLDEAAQRIAISSSQGPTRDGRSKPEIAASGTNVVAAKGFAGADDQWISMSGTSMASPFVAGLVGLMLGAEPTLTAAQIAGILQRTARPLPGASFAWANDAGFGVIDPDRCLEEAASTGVRQDVTP
jgi:subtilisin family serine protease